MYNFVFKTSLTSTYNVQKCLQTDLETEELQMKMLTECCDARRMSLGGGASTYSA